MVGNGVDEGERASAKFRRLDLVERAALLVEKDRVDEMPIDIFAKLLDQCSEAAQTGNFEGARTAFLKLLTRLAERKHELVLEKTGGAFLLATYMTAPPGERASALVAAAKLAALAGHGPMFFATPPIDRMEVLLKSSLPELRSFLPRWIDVLGVELGANESGPRVDWRGFLDEALVRVHGADAIGGGRRRSGG